MPRATKKKPVFPENADELAALMEASAAAYHRAWNIYTKCRADLKVVRKRMQRIQQLPMGSLPNVHPEHDWNS